MPHIAQELQQNYNYNCFTLFLSHQVFFLIHQLFVLIHHSAIYFDSSAIYFDSSAICFDSYRVASLNSDLVARRSAD